MPPGSPFVSDPALGRYPRPEPKPAPAQPRVEAWCGLPWRLLFLAATSACSEDAGTADEQRQYFGLRTLNGNRVLARLDERTDGDRLGISSAMARRCSAIGSALRETPALSSATE